MQKILNFGSLYARRLLRCASSLALWQSAAKPKRSQFPGGGIQCLATAAALAFAVQGGSSQTWSTVDDFQYSTGTNAYATGLAKDPTGTIIYASGDGQDAAGIWHALAFKSSDAGTTWSLMDDYADPTSSAGYGVGYDAGIAADPSGNIYASGFDALTSGAKMCFTRRSADGGTTWSTVDTWPANGMPHALAADSAGNIYVVGEVGSSSGAWIVRKGTGGTSWSTVDQLSIQNGGSVAYGVYCHSTAGVFVVGDSPAQVKHGSSYQPVWTVRRSRDGGTTWATVDTILDVGSRANSVGVDAAGNIYVAGRDYVSYKGGGYNTWLVRRSTDSGNSWVQVDDYGSSAMNALATAFACDAFGNVFVAGTCYTSAKGTQWLVRESVGGTGNWQSVDTFEYGSGQAGVSAVIGDSYGNVFVAGQASAGGVLHWIVRKH
jgi:hypothetical protein